MRLIRKGPLKATEWERLLNVILLVGYGALAVQLLTMLDRALIERKLFG